MSDLVMHELRLRASAVIGWGAGLAAYVILYVAIYPEIERQLGEAAAAAKFFSLYRVVGIEVGSFEAYFASAVVQFVAVLLGVYAILNGTDTLAGEEDRGTLELLIAMPIARWHVVAAKAVAMLVSAAMILAIAGLAGAAMVKTVPITTVVGTVNIFVAVMSAWPLVVAFMMVSLFFGSVLPTRRVASMTATIVFVASYFGERFTVLAKSLRPVSRWSLFHYLDCSSTLLTDGVKSRDLAVLLTTAAVFLVLSMLAFAHRDVTTHAWPWKGKTS